MKNVLLIWACVVSLSSNALDTGYHFERQPILVSASKKMVITRTEGSDRKLRFQTCSIEEDYLQSEQTLYNHLNSGAPTCVDLTADAIDLNDESKLSEFAIRYAAALTQEFGRRAKNDFRPAVELSVLAAGLAIQAVASAENHFPPTGVMVAELGGLGFILAVGIMTTRWVLAEAKEIRQRPPTELESDIIRLSTFREVSRPENFAPRAVFQSIENALATAL